MSEYNEQYSDNYKVCPYCGTNSKVEAEDYTDDDDWREEECDSCGKKFHYATNYTVSHNTSPDCKLNGLDHDFQFYSDERRAKFCAVCGRIDAAGFRKILEGKKSNVL